MNSSINTQMSKTEVTAVHPEHCLGCKSERIGIAEGRAFYKCGTMYDLNGKKAKVYRTMMCIEATGKVAPSEAGEPPVGDLRSPTSNQDRLTGYDLSNYRQMQQMIQTSGRMMRSSNMHEKLCTCSHSLNRHSEPLYGPNYAGYGKCLVGDCKCDVFKEQEGK